MKQLSMEAEENKNQYRANKKQQVSFNQITLESSFDALVESSRFSEFQKATQVVRALAQENTLQTGHELEEK